MSQKSYVCVSGRLCVPHGSPSPRTYAMLRGRRTRKWRDAMYAVIRRYQSDAGRLDEIRRLIDEDFLPQLTGVQGFVSYYAFDDGTGDVATVSVFLTKEKA